MRNKTLAVFVMLTLAVAFAVAQVPGIFSTFTADSLSCGTGGCALSNVPTAPTAAPGTSTTQVATTAFLTTSLASSQANCLTVACIGGSTYTGGTTYTNSSGHAVVEEVTGEQVSGASGNGFILACSVNGVQVQANGPLLNDYTGDPGYAGDTYFVPAGATFSCTLTNYATSPTPTIVGWYELPL